MSVELGQSSSIFLPQVPESVRDTSPELFDYLNATRTTLERAMRGIIGNDRNIVDAINSGTTGAFVINSGDTITVVNGIVTDATS